LTTAWHITEANTKVAKRMNVLLRRLAGTNWEADQGMLLRIHEMFFLSALEYDSKTYGSATDGHLKRLEHKAKDCAWCFLCMQNNKLTMKISRKKKRRKLTNIALHVAENENHPVNKLLRDQK
jgi:hypothetical protein